MILVLHTMYTLKKSLGQHFLHDENICSKIVNALQHHSFKHLLEIGPGAGALTKYLLQIPNIHFKAVEIDEEKINYLQQIHPSISSKLIHADILKIDAPFKETFAVIGNFPYNISSQILFKLIDWREQLSITIGMFQKEVALRIAAAPGNKTYGIISVLIQAYFEVKYLFEVHEKCFTPPPKVKSAVIELTPHKILPQMRSTTDFHNLVKTAFNQRRKTLRNAVKNLFNTEILRQDIFNKRAEALSVDDFAHLTYQMI